MRTYYTSQLTPLEWRELRTRRWSIDAQIKKSVEEICINVKRQGDAALREYTRQFDAVTLSDLRVSAAELIPARDRVSRGLLDAMRTATRNIHAFHTAQLRREQPVETTPGVVCWREQRPIERVGLYVPAGSAPLPSTALMLGVPALLAGCSRVIMCSPPKADGTVDPTILAAAECIGISEVYKVGGAQAIAAMAYGTESIPKVDKIFGPGNQYVTAAKQFVSSDPDGASIDLLAGPSELLILADEGADAKFVASDLLSQAEHDPNSQVVLITTRQTLANDVENCLERLLTELPRKEIASRALEKSFTLIVDSLEEGIRRSNDFAPEHLILNTADPERIMPLIRNAGSVFIGPYAPVTAGDYASGTNHTLPTGGMARWFSGLSVESFQKTLTFQRITRNGLQRLAPTLTSLAEAEGLEGHKRAVATRLGQ